MAATQRTSLGTHFQQLLAHTIRYAQARHLAQMETYLQKKTMDLAVWATRHAQQFIDGETPPLPDAWSNLRDATPGQFWNGSLTNDFDIGHINAALAWATDLDQASDERERQHWLELHRQAILCAVHRMEYWAQLEDETGDHNLGDSQRKRPYRDEKRLLERIAKIVARLKLGEPHAPLWQPIFALGANAPWWIQFFVSRWLLEAAGHEHPAPALIEQWVAMLDFAENCETWKKSTRRSRDISETWKHLLGLSPSSINLWHSGLETAVKAICPYFKRWALSNMQHDYQVRTIIDFLKTEAALSLRLDSLLWLKQHVSLDDDYFWKDDATRNTFAEFLRLLLDKHWTAIASSTPAHEAFMTLALKLSALQHPLGSEILTLAGHRLGT